MNYHRRALSQLSNNRVNTFYLFHLAIKEKTFYSQNNRFDEKPCSESVCSWVCRVSSDPMTTAVGLNNAFYFGIFENYSMNGSFRLKNEEKWMSRKELEKEEQRAHHGHTGPEESLIDCDRVGIIELLIRDTIYTGSDLIGNIMWAYFNHFGTNVSVFCSKIKERFWLEVLINNWFYYY